MTSNILPERPLDALHALWNWKRSWPNLDPAPSAPSDSPLRHLSRVELATMRLRADLSAERVPCQGIVFDAAMRIAVWADRGVLPYMSGWTVAHELQSLYYPRSFAMKMPVRGLDLLVAVDASHEHHGVSVTLDAEPIDGRHHRPMRLRDRFIEL